MNEPGLSFPESIFWLTILTPLAAGLGLGGVAGIGALLGIGIPFLPLLLITTVVAFFVQFIKIKLTLEETTDVDNLKRYFDLAIADQDVKRITVRPPTRSAGSRRAALQDDDRGRQTGRRAWITVLAALLRLTRSSHRKPETRL